MSKTQLLLTSIIGDFAILRKAYDKAGLLQDTAQGSSASKLLGSAENIQRFRRQFLLLDALVRHRVARVILNGGSFRHVVVFGGNNVGKSTVVNILAQCVAASSSPEGGHTKHAQVFVSREGPLFGENIHAFQGFSAVANGQLPKDRYDCYALSRLTTDALPQHVAVWDTPDCDSVGSARYVSAVIEAVAGADVVLYVTTVDKYAVEHLVEWLFHLHAAGTPIVECLNKTPKRHRDAVIQTQSKTIFPMTSEQLGLPAPAPIIVSLRNMVDSDDESDLWGPEHIEADQLRQAVLSALDDADRALACGEALNFLLHRIDNALEPVRMEIEARGDWIAAVDDAVAGFVASYELSYLTSGTAVEPISRLNLEILALLDPNIPGLKQTMQAIRWMTRWPAKLILSIGRQVVKLAFSAGTDSESKKVPPELKAYSEAHTGLLNKLGSRIKTERDSARHHPFWDTLDDEWQQSLERLTKKFGAEIEQHMTRTDSEIKEAARDIFRQLEQRPTTLNLLRAATVTANVGGALVGIFIPVKGGYVFDLLEEAIIAPTMMGAAEAAASKGVEAYVARRKDRIFRKLKEDAREIARTLYREPLLEIAEKAMSRSGALGVDGETLRRLPSDVRALNAAIAGELA